MNCRKNEDLPALHFRCYVQAYVIGGFGGWFIPFWIKCPLAQATFLLSIVPWPIHSHTGWMDSAFVPFLQHVCAFCLLHGHFRSVSRTRVSSPLPHYEDLALVLKRLTPLIYFLLASFFSFGFFHHCPSFQLLLSP